MPNIPINFSQGLVTARDASTLKPGELQTAKGCEYRVGSPHVYKQPGRTATGNSFVGTILGIHKYEYQTGDDKLVASAGGSMYEASPTTTPSFVSSGLNGLSTTAIPHFSSFNDTWIMCNGADINYVREANAVFVDSTGDGDNNWSKGNWRPLGLQPPDEKPAWVENALATGSTAAPAASAGGSYTNVDNARDSDLATYAYATVRTANSPKVTTWSFSGSIADISGNLTLTITHGSASSVNTIGINPVGHDVDVSTSWINAKQKIEVSEDGGANWTTISALGGTITSKVTKYTLTTVVFGDLSPLKVRATTEATLVTGDPWFQGKIYEIELDNGQAVGTYTTTNPLYYLITEKYIDSDEVPHESIASPISDAVPPDTYGQIDITLPSAANNDHTQQFVIYRTLDLPNQGFPFFYKIGEANVWEAGGTYQDRIGDVPSTTIDELGTVVYYGLNQLRGTEEAYEALAILYPTNETLYTSLNGAPPISKIAKLFQGSMVYVPTTGNRIHYSIPTNISSQGAEQVPAQYYLEFLTPLNDDVVSICTCNAGRSLIVYFPRYSMLVNYLPQATDPGVFDTRVSEYVSTHRGCAGRLLSLELDVGAGRTIAISVDKLGVWSTDGVSTLQEWSRDLDWDTLMSGVDLSVAELVNNPQMRRIELLYEDTSGDRQEMHFFYGRLKQDNDGNQAPLITGPHPMGVRCHHYGLDSDGEWQGWSGGTGAAGVFTLTPTLWFDAYDPYGDGTSPNDIDDGTEWVDLQNARWTDKAAGARHATTSQVIGNQPTWYKVAGSTPAPPTLPNSKPIMSFAGARGMGANTFSVLSLGAFTAFGVVYLSDENEALIGGSMSPYPAGYIPAELRIQKIDGSAGSRMQCSDYNYGGDYKVDYKTLAQGGTDFSGTPWRLVKFTRDSDIPAVCTHEIDGIDIGIFFEDNNNFALDIHCIMQTILNGNPGSPDQYNTWVAEIMVFDSLLSDTDQEIVETYLANKWDVGTPQATSDVFIERDGNEDQAEGYDDQGNIPFQVKTGDMYIGNLGVATMTIFGYPKFEGSTTKSLAGDSAQAVIGTFRRDGASAATTKTKSYTINTQKKLYWSQYADRHTFEVRDISSTSLPALVGYEIEVREGGPSRDK